MHPHRVVETALYVDDLEAAERFYTRVLGLKVHTRGKGRDCFFRVGPTMLLLFNPRETSKESGNVPAHGATGPGHAALAIAPEEVERWRRRLREEGVEIEREVEWPGGGTSLYFRDPAGNCLELVTPSLWGMII